MPLYSDTSLHVILGSHLRARTSLENTLLNDNPFTEELPNVLEMALRPGDMVLYDQNIIYRGVYEAGVPRPTFLAMSGIETRVSVGRRTCYKMGWETG